MRKMSWGIEFALFMMAGIIITSLLLLVIRRQYVQDNTSNTGMSMEEVLSSVPETTTETTEPSRQSLLEAAYEQRSASINTKYYHDHLYVAGDIIACGFNVYGTVPYEKSIVSVTVTMDTLNLDKFQASGKGFVETVVAQEPGLLYLSIGINDVVSPDYDDYLNDYQQLLLTLSTRLPDTVLVASAITPVTEDTSFANNNWIQRYNAALEEMVWEMNDPHILYFDAYRVLSDENGNMRKEYAESNGVRLSEKGCSAVLDALYRLLDAADAMPLLEKYDSMQPLIKQIETDEDGNIIYNEDEDEDGEDDEEAEEGDRDPEEDD